MTIKGVLPLAKCSLPFIRYQIRPPLTGIKPALVGSIIQSSLVLPIPKIVKIKESRAYRAYAEGIKGATELEILVMPIPDQVRDDGSGIQFVFLDSGVRQNDIGSGI